MNISIAPRSSTPRRTMTIIGLFLRAITGLEGRTRLSPTGVLLRSTCVVAFLVVEPVTAVAAVGALDLRPPPGSVNVAHQHANDGTGSRIEFEIVVPPLSYTIVDKYRDVLERSGYHLCTRSAISKWAKLPASTARDGRYWLMEMFSNERFKNFVVMRVDTRIMSSRSTSVQKFAIAELAIATQSITSSNIDEFCTPKRQR